MLNFSFQVKFRHGEAVRLEGVSGSAEGNPLLQVKEYLIIIQGADIILSPKYQRLGLGGHFVQRPIFFPFRLYRPNGRTWLLTGMAVFQALFDIDTQILAFATYLDCNICIWYELFSAEISRYDTRVIAATDLDSICCCKVCEIFRWNSRNFLNKSFVAIQSIPYSSYPESKNYPNRYISTDVKIESVKSLTLDIWGGF